MRGILKASFRSRAAGQGGDAGETGAFDLDATPGDIQWQRSIPAHRMSATANRRFLQALLAQWNPRTFFARTIPGICADRSWVKRGQTRIFLGETVVVSAVQMCLEDAADWPRTVQIPGQPSAFVWSWTVCGLPADFH